MKLFLLVLSLGVAACARESDVDSAGTGNEAVGGKNLAQFFREILEGGHAVGQILSDVKKRLDAGEEVDMAAVRDQLQPLLWVDTQGFGEELRLAAPIWKGLSMAGAYEGVDEEKQRLGFVLAGEGLWTLLNSEKAVPLLRAFLTLVEQGNLLSYLTALDQLEIVKDERFKSVLG